MFAQLYIYDPNEAMHARRQRNEGVSPKTMLALQQMLLEHNNFVPLMRQAYETLCEERENGNNNPDLAMHLHFEHGRQVRRYNLPQTDEIALILPGMVTFQMQPVTLSYVYVEERFIA